MSDPFEELVHLVNNIFTLEELSFLTKEVIWLKKTTRLTKRGKLKDGSRMVIIGIGYKYQKLNFFFYKIFYI